MYIKDLATISKKNNGDTALKVLCNVSLTSKGQVSNSSFEKVLNDNCFISEFFFHVVKSYSDFPVYLQCTKIKLCSCII